MNGVRCAGVDGSGRAEKNKEPFGLESRLKEHQDAGHRSLCQGQPNFRWHWLARQSLVPLVTGIIRMWHLLPRLRQEGERATDPKPAFPDYQVRPSPLVVIPPVDTGKSVLYR